MAVLPAGGHGEVFVVCLQWGGCSRQFPLFGLGPNSVPDSRGVVEGAAQEVLRFLVARLFL